jgi:hypothetical protein
MCLEEAHRLEEEIVKFTGIIYFKKNGNDIPDFEMVDYRYQLKCNVSFSMVVRRIPNHNLRTLKII